MANSGINTRWGFRKVLGFVLGILMFMGGTGWIIWNEQENAAQGDAIIEARYVTVRMPDVARIDPQFEGKMVHATGFADTTDTLVDSFSGFKTTALSLSRSVEYFQWVERREGESFFYVEEWRDNPIDSSEFRRDNRDSFENTILTRVHPTTMYADVSFGAYRLPQFILQEMEKLSPVPSALNLTQDEISALNRRIFPNTNRQLVHVRGNVIYLGRSPFETRIGDVRVTYTEVKPAVFSILAKVNQDTFEPFRASNDSTFSKVTAGAVDMEDMLDEAATRNTNMTWAGRVMAILLIVYGMKKFLSPWNPAGTGLKAWLLGLAWSFLFLGLLTFARGLHLPGAGLLISAALLIWPHRCRFKKAASKQMV